MTRWKFTMKDNRNGDLYFGYTHADTQSEAKKEIMNSIIDDRIKPYLEIFSIKEIDKRIRTVICGGAKIPHPTSISISDISYKSEKGDINDF